MEYGGASKFDYARQLAAAFAYLALIAGDEAEVIPFSDGIGSPLRVAGPKEGVVRLLDDLRGIAPAGKTDIDRSLKDFRTANSRRGLALIISDLLAADSRSAPATLAAAGHEVCVIHVLAREEAQPRQTGRLRMIDAETGRERRLLVGGAELARYSDLMNDFIEEWQKFCTAHRISFVTAFTDVPFEEMMLQYLRHGGVVR
jgi:uncharacterized protein (DUF58 family)